MPIDNSNEKIILKIAEGKERGRAVWFMRQAGRYLPDYSIIKGSRSFIDLMKDYKTIVEMTKMPIKYFDTDALVIFSDILLPLTRLGYIVNYNPVINVVRGDDTFDYYSVLAKALREISSSYSKKTIIGITPGPFTLLSYIYDNGERGYPNTKRNLYEGNISTEEIIEELFNFSKIQAENGADIIQIFESWIGNVSENFYDNYLHTIESEYLIMLRELKKPLIFFSEGASHLYRRIAKMDVDVFSLDWRTEFSYFKNFCKDCIVQGNLDPNFLKLDENSLEKEVIRIVNEGAKMKGHIFNLGHGVPPWADAKKLNFITEKVKSIEG